MIRAGLQLLDSEQLCRYGIVRVSMSLHNQTTHLDRAVSLNSFRFNTSLCNIRLLYAESPGTSEHLDEPVDLDLDLYQSAHI
jgi:hypothetical protein